jgi:PilZ domain
VSVRFLFELGAGIASSLSDPMERRKSPRIVPEQPLYARVEGMDGEFAVLDLSVGGLRLAGPIEFRLAATYRIRIATPPDGRVIELVAKAVSCRPSIKSLSTYESGFALLPAPHPGGQPDGQALPDELTPVRVG